MPYFTQDFIDFFAELEANNNREWFTANKSRFEKNVQKPFEKLVTDLIDRFQVIEPSIVLTAKDAIFRIYKDIRFSADKTPYKNHMSALIAPGGRKGMHSIGAYLELSAHHARLYGGLYAPEKPTLQKVREHIAAKLSEFDRLLHDKAFVKTFGTLHGEKNKRLPKELMEAAEKQPLIFNQAFYFFHSWEPKAILLESFPQEIIDTYLVGKPMGEFLVSGMR